MTSTTDKEKQLLEKLGRVDIDKVSAAYEARNSEADNMLSGLQDWIDDPELKFTEWEIDFINSVTDWRGNGRDITAKQLETLQKIYDKKL